jgi:hypothetical protein
MTSDPGTFTVNADVPNMIWFDAVVADPLPRATAFEWAADAPAVEASPDPIATAFAADARAPLTAAPFDAPMAIAPCAVAFGAAVEFAPEPMAIASAPVVA